VLVQVGVVPHPVGYGGNDIGRSLVVRWRDTDGDDDIPETREDASWDS
jgi:hypothetical protein